MITRAVLNLSKDCAVYRGQPFQEESTLHPNDQVIQIFYQAFHARDAAGMNACYGPGIVFTDPAFGRLEGQQVLSMWQMLCLRAKDLQISVDNIHTDDHAGSAHWEAKYSFGPSRRPVHNLVEATFAFCDGKIIEHKDIFDMWRWSRMAVGPTGVIFGWSSVFKSAIQKRTRHQLDEFIRKQPSV